MEASGTLITGTDGSQARPQVYEACGTKAGIRVFLEWYD